MISVPIGFGVSIIGASVIGGLAAGATIAVLIGVPLVRQVQPCVGDVQTENTDADWTGS